MLATVESVTHMDVSASSDIVTHRAQTCWLREHRVWEEEVLCLFVCMYACNASKTLQCQLLSVFPEVPRGLSDFPGWSWLGWHLEDWSAMAFRGVKCSSSHSYCPSLLGASLPLLFFFFSQDLIWFRFSCCYSFLPLSISCLFSSCTPHLSCSICLIFISHSTLSLSIHSLHSIFLHHFLTFCMLRRLPWGACLP